MPRADRILPVLTLTALTASPLFAGTETLCAPPAPLTDLGSVTETLVFDAPAGAVVTGLRVDLRVTHQWVGDLVLEIEHDGQTRTLIDRPGRELFSFGCGGDLLDVTLDDDAPNPIGPCTPDDPDIVGTFLPLESLGIYNGQSVEGGWTLTVRDANPFDEGTIEELCLTVEYEAAAICPGDCDGSGSVDFGDLVAILGEFGSATPSPACDADTSGAVDFGDLVTALGLFGPCP